MAHDTRGIAQHLVGDRAALDQYPLLLHHVDEQRVLVEGEGVAQPSRAEEHGVEEVVVRGVAVAEALAGVEEEGDVDALGGAGAAEPEELGREVLKRAAKIFLSYQVVACDEGRVALLDFDALRHVFVELYQCLEWSRSGEVGLTIYDCASRMVSHRRPYYPRAPETLTLIAGHEVFDDLMQDTCECQTSLFRRVFSFECER